jgi:peptidoglycan/LPS O-acetylase OafA/YrhL
MQYRQEVDGLRALAVLPVIFFHAGFPAFGGGFVGVDVFFVISGYLITSIIIDERETGKFSLVKFYERRARRILPALFFVLAVCLPFAWMWLLPGDTKSFSKGLVAVTLYVSNILFWRESGYFESAAELNPLLHTWSLSVEEQYYLLFPLFLALVWRFGRTFIITALTVIGLASLAISHWGVSNQPVGAFFLLPTRGWELLIGSLSAFYLRGQRTAPCAEGVSNVASLVGLLLLGYSVAVFNKYTPFPGWRALFPTVGTALIILFATPKSLVGHVLGSKPFVAVGLISYSAYLWHQPLFAFARLRSLHEPSALLFVGLSILSLGLAYLSWKFVEKPFRNAGSFDRRAIFTYAGVASAIAIAIGVVGIKTNGYFYRTDFEKQFSAIEQKNRPTYGLDVSCESEFTLNAKCATSSEPELVLWGDSYAMHLVPALLASKPDIKLVQMTVSTCGPILGAAINNQKYIAQWSKRCIESNDKVLDYIRKSKTVKYAVLSSPFSQFVGNDVPLMLRDGSVVDGNTVALKLFRETLLAIKSAGVKPVIVSPTPRSAKNIGNCLARAQLFGWAFNVCDFEWATAEQTPIIEFLREINKEYRVIWLFDEICPSTGKCKSQLTEHFTYRDFGHLSHDASAHLGKKMDFYRLISAD